MNLILFKHLLARLVPVVYSQTIVIGVKTQICYLPFICTITSISWTISWYDIIHAHMGLVSIYVFCLVDDPCPYWNCGLTYWGRDKWLPFLKRHIQTYFLEWKCSNFGEYITGFCSVWFSWLCTEQATSHYLYRWCHSLRMHICVTRHQSVNYSIVEDRQWTSNYNPLLKCMPLHIHAVILVLVYLTSVIKIIPDSLAKFVINAYDA